MDDQDLPIAGHPTVGVLSDRQHHAIELLVTGVPRLTVAETVGVARSTLYNWLNSPAFASELDRRRVLVRENLADESVAMFRLAVRAARNAVESGDVTVALALLRLLDMDDTIAPKPPTCVNDFLDADIVDADHSTQSEVSTRPFHSVLAGVGDATRRIEDQAVETTCRQAQPEVAADPFAAGRLFPVDGMSPTPVTKGR